MFYIFIFLVYYNWLFLNPISNLLNRYEDEISITYVGSFY